MYAWSSRDRLCPPRMIWLGRNPNQHKFELAKWRRNRWRAWVRIDRDMLGNSPGFGRVVRDRELRQMYPGRTGNFPIVNRPKRVV